MKIAVIPARGGSKRIPKKNIKSFCGKPIIAWSIEMAHSSKLFDRVIVSTDDNEIAAIASKYGAEVPFIRPKDISDDFTGTNAVIKHAIEWLQENDVAIDYVCCIYPTAPLLQKKYLIDGFNLLLSEGKDYVFSVTKYEYPVYRSFTIDDKGVITPIWKDKLSNRSQDLDDVYHDAGQFYWGKAQSFLEELEIFTKDSVPVKIPHYLVQDIDTLDDWLHAEIKFKIINNLVTTKV